MAEVRLAEDAVADLDELIAWVYRYDAESEIVEVARVFDIRTSSAPALTEP